MDRNRGFTLIEIIIVMFVTAILIAIAIPQYHSYRMGSFNSAASSDLKNTRAVLESFYSDHGFFPSSTAGGAPGAGTVFNSVVNTTGIIPAGTVFPPNVPARDIPAPGFAIGPSQNVGLVVHTSAVILTFTMGAKNTAGDRCFGMDPDPSAMYWINGLPGSSLTAGSIPVPVSTSSNFLQGGGTPGIGICAGLPPGAGQAIWATL